MRIIEYLKDKKKSAPERIKGFINWLLENGKEYASTIDNFDDYEDAVMSSVMKQCYRNSMIAVKFHDNLKYVGGFYLVRNDSNPLRHGFNIDENGDVVDVTAKAVGIPVKEYFGVEIEKKYIKEFVELRPFNSTPLEWYYDEYVK